jgi:hypothetical protein
MTHQSEGKQFQPEQNQMDNRCILRYMECTVSRGVHFHRDLLSEFFGLCESLSSLTWAAVRRLRADFSRGPINRYRDPVLHAFIVEATSDLLTLAAMAEPLSRYTAPFRSASDLVDLIRRRVGTAKSAYPVYEALQARRRKGQVKDRLVANVYSSFRDELALFERDLDTLAHLLESLAATEEESGRSYVG